MASIKQRLTAQLRSAYTNSWPTYFEYQHSLILPNSCQKGGWHKERDCANRLRAMYYNFHSNNRFQRL